MNKLAVLTTSIVGITGLYLLSLMPGRLRKKGFAPFENTYIAHRGLYDNSGDAPENSLKAFKKAVDAGFGVELDVQITSDGRLVVFHDETLRRMCNADVRLTDLTFEQLEQYTLADSDEQIPLFSDVFDIFKDKAPALIEIKAHGHYIRTAELLMDHLDGYNGDFCVQSFHPRLVHWFYRNRPDVIRGQLSTVFDRSSKVPWVAKFVATNLMTNIYARPDFISYDVRHIDQFSYRLLRKLYKVKNASWTIQNREQLEKAKKAASIFIFDSFDPRDEDPGKGDNDR